MERNVTFCLIFLASLNPVKDYIQSLAWPFMAYPTSTTIVDRTYIPTNLVVMDPDVTLVATNLICKSVTKTFL